MATRTSGFDYGALVLVMVIIAASVLVVISGLMFGSRIVEPDRVFSVLFNPDGPDWPDGMADRRIDTILVWTLRLPRSLTAFVAGAGLSIAGYLLQSLTRNPLAGPGLTGTTAGAVLPIVICISFLPQLSPVYLPFIGMAGGIMAALVTFWIAHGGLLSSNRGRPLHLTLGGINVSLFLSSITIWVIMTSGGQVPAVLFWLAGGFSGRSWTQLYLLLPFVAIGCLGALMSHRIIGLMYLDEKSAAGMGLNLSLWRPIILWLAVMPVAGIVPVAGPIAFIGLASPHLARLIRTTTPIGTLALSATIGGFVTATADIIARSIAAPREIPVGIIIALFAGPVFIWLVQSRRFEIGS